LPSIGIIGSDVEERRRGWGEVDVERGVASEGAVAKRCRPAKHAVDAGDNIVEVPEGREDLAGEVDIGCVDADGEAIGASPGVMAWERGALGEVDERRPGERFDVGGECVGGDQGGREQKCPREGQKALRHLTPLPRGSYNPDHLTRGGSNHD